MTKIFTVAAFIVGGWALLTVAKNEDQVRCVASGGTVDPGPPFIWRCVR